MPTYRIISELDPGAEHRESRGARLRLDEARLVSTISAPDLPRAVQMIHTDPCRAGDHEPRRVTFVEELHPGFSFTDAQLTAALTDPEGAWGDEPMIDPEEFEDGVSIYASGDFIWTVQAVADALRESDLVPGLGLSLLHNSEGFVDYSLVEVHDDKRGIYLAQGSEITRLIGDRTATGWAGILSIARELIALSNHLH